MRILQILLLLLLPASAQAETYMNFKPAQTLKEVREQYPRAELVEKKIAWLAESYRFYDFSGAGITGAVALIFQDSAHVAKELGQLGRIIIEKNSANKSQEELDAARKAVEEMEAKAKEPLEQRLMLTNIRWSPASLLPVDRFIEKYGKPQSTGVNETSFAPYMTWKIGVSANLTDDKKYIKVVEYSFTDEDYKMASKEK